MLSVGLTGGIGSGKSLIAGIFSHLGIAVFNADTEAGKILDEDFQIRRQLTEWLGPGIYIDGKPDRVKLARIIFSDQEMLTRMNSIIHPRVMEMFVFWRGKNQDSPYLIHEAAILFESGFYRHLDTTILVTAPEKIRMERVKLRDKTTEESIRLRMRNQWTDEQKLPLAGYLIQNDGASALVPQVLEIHNKLIG